ncbi:hypothetical protein [Chitinilyticum litopenaei]|uniref:hypothetical protein n=1 Tax=Chitinilyticum litopenaei TaxID=1121276 RepID=UPI00118640BF|nr:hypothetical protein [Chitinilyticum litopenaei]
MLLAIELVFACFIYLISRYGAVLNELESSKQATLIAHAHYIASRLRHNPVPADLVHANASAAFPETAEFGRITLADRTLLIFIYPPNGDRVGTNCTLALDTGLLTC